VNKTTEAQLRALLPRTDRLRREVQQLRRQTFELACLVDELVSERWFMRLSPSFRCGLIRKVGRLKARIQNHPVNERAVAWYCGPGCKGHRTSRRIGRELKAKR
jgi:hypothetical protein